MRNYHSKIFFSYKMCIFSLRIQGVCKILLRATYTHLVNVFSFWNKASLGTPGCLEFSILLLQSPKVPGMQEYAKTPGHFGFCIIVFFVKLVEKILVTKKKKKTEKNPESIFT